MKDPTWAEIKAAFAGGPLSYESLRARVEANRAPDFMPGDFVRHENGWEGVVLDDSPSRTGNPDENGWLFYAMSYNPHLASSVGHPTAHDKPHRFKLLWRGKAPVEP